jgi:hypothetical protein
VQSSRGPRKRCRDEDTYCAVSTDAHCWQCHRLGTGV